MSKAVRTFFSKIRANFSMSIKFTAFWNAGNRIVPAKNSKNDTEYQLRIDAGELLENRYRMLYLQVNSQAKNTTLKEFRRKHGTHANLATTQFDTLAEDLDAETDRALIDLQDGANASL